jgi:hypothetical protein
MPLRDIDALRSVRRAPRILDASRPRVARRDRLSRRVIVSRSIPNTKHRGSVLLMSQKQSCVGNDDIAVIGVRLSVFIVSNGRIWTIVDIAC